MSYHYVPQATAMMLWKKVQGPAFLTDVAVYK